MDTLDVLADLSTREMQALGALCLHRFCKVKGIKHRFIDELVEHLLSILISMPLDGWERNGAALSLSGRGDPVPDALMSRLSEDVREDFHRLVEFVVEIGFADMYGATTTRPLHNLLRCMSILDDNGIERPTVADLFKDRLPRGKTIPDWGEVYSSEQYTNVKAAFR